MIIEISNNITKLQVSHMADFTEIELSSQQISRYIQYRNGIFDKGVPEGTTSLTILSDQKLLDTLLTPEQRSVFRLHYHNIFLHSNVPEV